MRFKLHENFGVRTRDVFRNAGHDVTTVHDQGLGGTSDATLYDTCRSEHRCMVTLDLDFANVLRYPPEDAAGIIVVRLPRNVTARTLDELARQIIWALDVEELEGKLWIVEPGRIRVHQDR